MKKTIFAIALALLMVASSTVAFADGTESIMSKVTGVSDAKITEYRTQGIGYGQLIPASIIAKLSGDSIDNIIKERIGGKTYYTIAENKDIKIEDYKDQLLEKKNTYVDELQKSGAITEEQAKIAKDRFAKNIASCDGTTIGAGRSNGAGMGLGMGRYNNNGNAFGRGVGRGFGRGMGRGFAPNSTQAQ